MAGQLDTALKNIAKQVVAQLGDSLDTTIVYTRKGVSSYDNTTGQYITVDTNYTIKVPIEFVEKVSTGFRKDFFTNDWAARWKIISGLNFLITFLSLFKSLISKNFVLIFLFNFVAAYHDGVVGIFLEIPRIFAPKFDKASDNQAPLNPVCPVIKIFLFL